jgi:ABC-type multidrug transport system ATPase subunit
MAIQNPSIENDIQAGTEGVTLQVKKVERLPKGQDRALVSNISMHVGPGELVAVAGPGKSALLESLSGVRPPDDGQILFNGIDLYGNLRVLSTYIGYVPSTPAVHDSLTPREALRYEAGLRLAGASEKRIAHRVQEVLGQIGLLDLADRQVEGLSILEKRLLSVGIELLASPGLLLVDEPHQPIAPAEAARVTTLLQRLARQGLTVLQASDIAACASLADKMAVLAPDGSLAWYGPPPEALEYFRGLHPGAEALNSSFNLEKCLEVPGLTRTVDGRSLGQVFLDQPYFQKYVGGPLSGKRSDLLLEDRPMTRFRGALAEGLPPPRRPQPSFLQKLLTLVRRNFVTTVRARRLLLLLAAPILLALTDLLFSSPGMNDPLAGDPRGQPAALGALVFLNLLTAALLFQNEVHGERAIIRTERRSVSLALPYAFSKIWWVGAFSIFAGVVWAVIHFAASGFEGGLNTLGGYLVTFVLVAFIGGGLGLLASALSRTSLAASSLALLFVVPQFLLSGSVIPLANLARPVRPLALVNPARYAFDVLLTLSAYGKDVVADACWQMTTQERTLLTEAQKQSCDCMGINIFSRCAFPGIYRSFNYVIEQPRPILPIQDPGLVAPPVQPQPQPGQSPEAFQEALAEYAAQVEAYLAAGADYNRSLQTYTTTLEDWQRRRSLAIGSAEASIADAIDHYGHAFNVQVVSYWFILAGISLVLTVLMVVVIPR